MPDKYKSKILIDSLEIEQANMLLEDMLLVCFKKQLRGAVTAGVRITDITIKVEPHTPPYLKDRYICVTLEGETR